MSCGLPKSKDKTLQRNTIKYYMSLINEYENIEKKHPSSRKHISAFYQKYNIKRQNFNKTLHRYKQEGENGLLPKKRGPKYCGGRSPDFIKKIIENHRHQGLSVFHIYHRMKPELKDLTPAKSTIYNHLKRIGLNRKLKSNKKELKRVIIKENAGDLGHIDCYYLPKDIIIENSKRYYLVCLLDDASRVAWAGIVENLKAINVMFKSLECITYLNAKYGIDFKEILSDNGAEFGSGPSKNNKQDHPFEVLLSNLKIKHRYTKPYRPQTNGKVERWWRTFNEEFVEDTVFENLEVLQDELNKYLMFYNGYRPHQSLAGDTPEQALAKLKDRHRIT